MLNERAGNHELASKLRQREARREHLRADFLDKKRARDSERRDREALEIAERHANEAEAAALANGRHAKSRGGKRPVNFSVAGSPKKF